MALSTSFIFSLVDKYSAVADKMAAKTKNFDRQLSKTSKRLGAFANKSKKMGKMMMVPGLAIAGAFTGASKAAMTFEDSMVDANRYLKLTTKEMNKLRPEILGVSDEIGLAAEQVAFLYGKAHRLGLENKKAFTKDARIWMVLTGQSAEETAGAYDVLTTVLKNTVTETSRVVDAIAHLNRTSNTEIQEMHEGLRRMAPMILELKPDQVVAAAWVDIGVQAMGSAKNANAAWTGFYDQLKAHAKSGNTEARGLLIALEKDFSGTMKYIISKAKDSDWLADVFSTSKANDLLKNLSNQGKLVNDVLNKVSDESKYIGTAQKLWGEHLETTSYKWAKMTTMMKNMAVDLGTELLPIMKELLDEYIIPMVERMKNNPESVKKWAVIIGTIVVALGPILILLSYMAQSILWIIAVLTGFWAKIIGARVAAAALVSTFKHLFNAGGFIRGIKMFLLFNSSGTKLHATIILIWKALRWLIRPLLVLGSFLVAVFGWPVVAIAAIIIAIITLITYFEWWGNILDGLIWLWEKVAYAATYWMNVIKNGFNKLTNNKIFRWLFDDDSEKEITFNINEQKELSSNSSSRLDGEISISVDGPGKVRRFNINSTRPGNLGMNVMPGGA